MWLLISCLRLVHTISTKATNIDGTSNVNKHILPYAVLLQVTLNSTLTLSLVLQFHFHWNVHVKIIHCDVVDTTVLRSVVSVVLLQNKLSNTKCTLILIIFLEWPVMQLSYFAEFIWTSLHRSVLDNSSVVESHFHFNSYVHFIVLYHCFFQYENRTIEMEARLWRGILGIWQSWLVLCLLKCSMKLNYVSLLLWHACLFCVMNKLTVTDSCLS